MWKAPGVADALGAAHALLHLPHRVGALVLMWPFVPATVALAWARMWPALGVVLCGAAVETGLRLSSAAPGAAAAAASVLLLRGVTVVAAAAAQAHAARVHARAEVMHARGVLLHVMDDPEVRAQARAFLREVLLPELSAAQTRADAPARRRPMGHDGHEGHEGHEGHGHAKCHSRGATLSFVTAAAVAAAATVLLALLGWRVPLASEY